MSAPEKMYTERDMILAQRDAVQQTVTRLWSYIKDSGRTWIGADPLATELFPLPKVERPRVVADPLNLYVEWRVVPLNGARTLMWRSNGGECGNSIWKVYPTDNGGVHHMPCWERVTLWADLFQNPTELVEAES